MSKMSVLSFSFDGDWNSSIGFFKTSMDTLRWLLTWKLPIIFLKVQKCTTSFSSWLLKKSNFCLNDWMCSSILLANCFLPSSFVFRSERCWAISTKNARLIITLLIIILFVPFQKFCLLNSKIFLKWQYN